MEENGDRKGVVEVYGRIGRLSWASILRTGLVRKVYICICFCYYYYLKSGLGGGGWKGYRYMNHASVLVLHSRSHPRMYPPPYLPPQCLSPLECSSQGITILLPSPYQIPDTLPDTAPRQILIGFRLHPASMGRSSTSHDEVAADFIRHAH